jgi:hypothetical protein
MPKQEPGKSNLKFSDLRVTGENSMSRKHRKTFIALWLISAILFISGSAQETKKKKPAPLVIQAQGSFAVGGSVVTSPGTFDPIKQGVYNPAGTDPAGQTLHGDHAYVFYQVPVNARKLPLVFWHGHGQSAKTWETTPDGREGFQNIFLRRRFPVYLIDQPRRGRAARGTQPIAITGTPDEQLLVRHLPARRLAEPLPRRAVLARPGGLGPVLPADGPQHRLVRREGEYRRRLGAIR